MAQDSTWSRRGEQAVGAAADLVAGLGRGLGQLGGRIRRGQYRAFVEGLCAVAGDVASQNGRLKKEELEGFRKFLVDNRANPAIKPFDPDELTEKFREYAIKAFLCEETAFLRAVDEVKRSSEKKGELGELIVIAALGIAYADGDCDELELQTIEQYAKALQVELPTLVRSLGIELPEPAPAVSAVKAALPAEAGAGGASVATLQAGAKVDIDAAKVQVAVRWSPSAPDGADVDVSAFLLGKSGKVRSDADFIFYNQARSPHGGVELVGERGDQTFDVDLSVLPDDVQRIAFAITLDPSASFSSLEQLLLRMEGHLEFAPATKGVEEKALILGELYRKDGKWRFAAVGQGFVGGLGALAGHYGVDVA
jgi:stress response protein SCP2/tellurite resistance protein